MIKKVERITKISKHGGTSGASAFWSGAWSSNTDIGSENYKGFTLQYEFKGYRYASTKNREKNASLSDWRNEVNAALEEYEATNYKDYIKKVKEEGKKEKEEDEAKKKMDREPNKNDNNKGDGKPDNVSKKSWTTVLEEIKKLKESKKTEPEQVKDMKEIMKTIKEKNREETEKINQEVEQLREENVSVAKKLQKAIESGNKAQEALLLKEVNRIQNSMGDKLIEKDNVMNENDVIEYIKQLNKERNGSFWENITFDWKSPRSYALLGLLIIIIFVVFALFMWIWGKIKSFLSSNKN